MTSAFVERQVENAVRDAVKDVLDNKIDDKAVSVMKSISRLAAKQGGESTMENYQLLGKRALIVLAVAVVAVQVTYSAVSFVVSRKSEEQRIEKVVRRVLEEERLKAQAEAYTEL